MSSQARSSSGVRDLRAMFENKNEPSNETSSDRGRSPGAASQSRSPSARKIRSSLVTVDSSERTTLGNNQMDGISERRESFSVTDKKDDPTLQEAQVSVIDELRKRQGAIGRPEPVPEQAVTTPGAPMSDRNEQFGHPDKPVSSVKDQSAVLNPADPKLQVAVSGGDALKKKPSLKSEKGQQKTSEKTTKAKPPNLSTASRASYGPSKPSSKSSPKTPTTASNFRKSTAVNQSKAQRTSAVSSNTSPSSKSKARSPTRPVNLPSNLTQPTASSAAKHEPEKKDSMRPQQKAGGSRTATKPVALPSRLTAGTASSNAKHETYEAPPTSKPAASTRASLTGTNAKPRASLAAGTSSKKKSSGRVKGHTDSEKKTSGTPSEGFLARMMKPTASSSHRAASDLEQSESKTVAPSKPAHAADRTVKSPSKVVAGNEGVKKDSPKSFTVSSERIAGETENKADDEQAEANEMKASNLVKPVQPHPSVNEQANGEESAHAESSNVLPKADNPTQPVMPKSTTVKPEEGSSGLKRETAPPASLSNSSISAAEPTYQNIVDFLDKSPSPLPSQARASNNGATDARLHKAEPTPLMETDPFDKSHVPGTTTSDVVNASPFTPEKLAPMPPTTNMTDALEADDRTEKVQQQVKHEEAKEDSTGIDNSALPTANTEVQTKSIETNASHAEMEETSKKKHPETTGAKESATKEKESTPTPHESAAPLEGTPGFEQQAGTEVIR